MHAQLGRSQNHRGVGEERPREAHNLETSVRLGELADGQVQPVDLRVEVERLVMLRYELMRLSVLAAELTSDQRLVLACQVGLQMERGEFCRRYSWSGEKYRKVAQRAHEKFADLLIAEVEVSLEGADLADVREELEALSLLPYCRSALERRVKKN